MDPETLASNPQDDARPTILGVTLAMTSLAVIVLGTRVYVRTVMIKSFGSDDILMTISTAMAVVLAAVIIVECNNGHGRHIGDVPPERYMVGLKYNFISQPIVFVCTNMVKLSIGAALLRIAATRFWKSLIWSIMGLMIFYTIGAFVLTFSNTIVMQCHPVAVQWDPTVGGSCWAPLTLQALAYTSVALNIFTDVMFAIVIPLPMLWGLNLNRRSKAALLFVLSLGLFACVASAVKISYLARYGVRDDYLWDTRHITIWSIMELTLGIVAGSLPPLKPIFKSIIGTTKRYATSKTPNYQSNYHSSGTGFQKSGSGWKSRGSFGQALSRDLDGTSSERELNISRANGPDEYDLDNYPKSENAFVTEIECGERPERGSQGEGPDGVDRDNGITMRTTTTVSFLNR